VGNKGVVKGMGPREKKRLKNDRNHCDQGEERKPKGYVSNNGVVRTQIFFLLLWSYTPT
jgi:hypothetical protein